MQIGAEITIDVCCATVAEVRKRGEKFWGEFEFYLSDLAVGMVLDIVLVTLLAPVAVIGKYPKAVESTGALHSGQWQPPALLLWLLVMHQAQIACQSSVAGCEAFCLLCQMSDCAWQDCL